MTQSGPIQYTHYAGPNVHAPRPLVVAEFRLPIQTPLDTESLARRLATVLPARVTEPLAFAARRLPFEAAAAELARVLLNLAGSGGLTVNATRADDRARLLLDCIDHEVSQQVCDLALWLTHALASDRAPDPSLPQNLGAGLRQLADRMRAFYPNILVDALLRAAQARGIPAYPLVRGSHMWRYGQGSAGRNLFETGTGRDSLIGENMARDKFFSNRMVRRLGFPGVEHAVAADAGQARTLARQLGYPLVVKPAGGGKGVGVTANIVSDAEFDQAVARALPQADGRLLVERFIPGADHRLLVVGGTLLRAMCRTPATLTGDGRSTVQDLIETENAGRRNAFRHGDFAMVLTLDDDMVSVLAKQGLAPDSVPIAGREFHLRSIANRAAGGDIADHTEQVHPDNRDMAEAIARGFGLEIVGIDFMTPDISQSWRDVPCGVLEVNTRPGFSSDEIAVQMIDRLFPAPKNGRIPSIVTVGAESSAAVAALAGLDLTVGVCEPASTSLNGKPRGLPGDGLGERVTSLLLDPTCEAIVIATDPATLAREGFPLDRADLVVLGPDVEAVTELTTLLETCSERRLSMTAAEEHELVGAIKDLVAGYRGSTSRAGTAVAPRK